MSQWRVTITLTTDDTTATDWDGQAVAEDMADTVPPHWWADVDEVEAMRDE